MKVLYKNMTYESDKFEDTLEAEEMNQKRAKVLNALEERAERRRRSATIHCDPIVELDEE